MKKLSTWAKIFSRAEASENSGLFVSLEELIEQRKYVGYLKHIASKLSLSNQAGDIKSAFKGRGIELEEIRNYTYGDDVRDMDWRVTAKKGTPYTKLYAEEKDREIYVALDLSPYMVFGTRKQLKSVSAAKIAGLLGWLSQENKDRFGCMIYDGAQNYFFKAKNHKSSLIAIFKKISEISQSILQSRAEKSNFAKQLKILQSSIKSQASVFVISDYNFMTEELKKTLAGMAKKAKVYLINVYDILEDIAPKAGEYMVAEGDKKLVFSSSAKSFQKEYKSYFEHKRAEVKEFALKFSCQYVEVRGDIEIYKQLKLF